MSLAERVETTGTGVEGRISIGHGGGYRKRPARRFSGQKQLGSNYKERQRPAVGGAHIWKS